jgi:hypothetical protein
MKIQYVLDALKNGNNKFTVAHLTDVIRADAGDKALERRTRRALFVARKAGIILEPLRDGGKAVVAYQLMGGVPTSAWNEAHAVATRKASRARTKTVTAKTISKEVDAIVAKNKAPSKKAAVTDDVKAKNLAKLKAVHRTIKQDVAKHPITNRELTDEQADALEEFRALESGWETEEQTRNAARAAVRENLPKEFYAE